MCFNFYWERLAARRSLTGKAGQRHHEMIALEEWLRLMLWNLLKLPATASGPATARGLWNLKRVPNFIGSACGMCFNFYWERLTALRSLTGKAGQRHHEMIAGRALFDALE